LKNNIFYTNENFSWAFAACLAISAFPVLPYGILSVAIALFVVFSAVDIYQNRQAARKNITTDFRKYLIFTLFYLILILSSFWSDHTLKSLNAHTVGIPILLFPLSFVFGKSRLQVKQRHLLLVVFVTASVIAGFFILGLAYEELSKTGFKQLFYSSALRRNMAKETSFLRFHPTYISLCFLLSIGILISWFKKKQKVIQAIVKTVAIAFLIFMIIICASRAAVLTTALAGLVFFLKTPRFRVFYKVLIISAFSMLSYVAITNIFLLSSRFLIIANELVLPKGESPSSISIRYGIYECSFEITKENWMFGVGVGDLQNRLNDCYAGFLTNHFKSKKINTHNYFLHLLNSAGIFSLLAICWLLIYLFRIAIREKNDLFLLFLIIMLVNLFFENLLVRSYGVVFFAFFTAFFFLSKPTNG
jgi:O-antigen ligase